MQPLRKHRDIGLDHENCLWQRWRCVVWISWSCQHWAPSPLEKPWHERRALQACASARSGHGAGGCRRVHATGRLGLLLAIPPGYGRAIWPPSGYCASRSPHGWLSGMARRAAGVIAGPIWAVHWTPLAQWQRCASVAFTTSIAAGAALQAVVGRYLVCRFVGFPSALDREKEIACFSPAGRATQLPGEVPPLGSRPRRPAARSRVAVPIRWWTWWVGDTLAYLSSRRWY